MPRGGDRLGPAPRLGTVSGEASALEREFAEDDAGPIDAIR